MNIVFVAPGLNKNRGGERVIFKYAEAMAKRGHNVSILVPQNTVFLNSDLISIIEYKSIFSPFVSRQIGYIDSIIQAISKIPSNVDILIGTYVPQLIIPIFYKLLHKNTKFIMFNQDFSAMFKNRPERQLMFSIYPKFVDKAISISKFCYEELYNISKIKSLIIPNGIEDEFLNCEVNEKPLFNTDYIFWLGSKNKHKGFVEFFNAMKIVWEKYPNLKLITVKNNYPINSNLIEVEINGNFKKLINLYKNAKLFVCSSYQEGFGLPALEAMACGCPVVTTDTGGSREYAINNYNATIVAPQNIDELANAIIDLINDNEKQIFYSMNGVKTAEKFKWDIAFNNFNEEVIK